MGTERVRIRILVPLAIALIGMMGIFITGAFRLVNRNLDEEVERHLTSVKNILRAQQHENLHAMSTTIINIKENKSVQASFLRGDRTSAVNALEPFYTELRLNHYISHLCLHDSTGHNFLRMHDTARHGDLMNRFIVTTARKTNRPSYGLELCDHGRFLMRLAIPWSVNGRLIGFIELGKELTDITRGVPATLGISTLTLIDKEDIDRKAWESSGAPDKRPHTWEDFPQHVVIDRSVAAIPPAIQAWLSVADREHSHRRSRIDHDGQTYWTAMIPLIDAESREVGDLMVYFDATTEMNEAYNLLYSITGFCVLIGLALFISFYKMLGAIELELTESHNTMVNESQARLDVEKRHARELATHIVELERARAQAVNLARKAEHAQRLADEAQKELRESQKVDLKRVPPQQPKLP